MLITDDFVMLNFPKTGSSFARTAIKLAYRQSSSRAVNALEKLGILKPRMRELMLPKIDEKHHSKLHDQHGTWRQIPAKFQSRRVVSITREPVSRYHSAYRFGWWKQYPPGDPVAIRHRYPNFPNLSFQQFYEMTHYFSLQNRLKGITPKIELGAHTVQFIQFYFRNPDETLRIIDNEYIDQKKYLDDIANVHFLEQTNLTYDLKNFLIEVGRRPADLEFLDEMKEVNTTERDSESETCEDVAFNQYVAADVMVRDRLIYTIFPHYCHNQL